MSKELLEEIIDEIKDLLPDGLSITAYLNDADNVIIDESPDSQALGYQYGRLVGAADWHSKTVLELLDIYEVVFWDPDPPQPPCTIYSEYCPQHDFVHGAEAEELRAGIEELMVDYDLVDGKLLQVLLDKVAARDSLAYLETQDTQPIRKEPLTNENT